MTLEKNKGIKKQKKRQDKIVKKTQKEDEKEDEESEKKQSVIVKMNFLPDIKKQHFKEEINKNNILKLNDMDHNSDKNLSNKNCKCNEYKEIISKMKNKYEKNKNEEPKYYNIETKIISTETNKKMTFKKTSIKCWWDCHEFNNLPFFLPESYNNGVFYVMGYFCSPNCALAYNLLILRDSNMYNRKSLIYYFYKKITGMKPSDNIDFIIPPSKEILKDFGGTMTIEMFRNKFNLINCHFTTFIPPIRPYNIIVEEKTFKEKSDDNEYVLKRKNPLSKCQSLISISSINNTKN